MTLTVPVSPPGVHVTDDTQPPLSVSVSVKLPASRALKVVSPPAAALSKAPSHRHRPSRPVGVDPTISLKTVMEPGWAVLVKVQTMVSPLVRSMVTLFVPVSPLSHATVVSNPATAVSLVDGLGVRVQVREGAARLRISQAERSQVAGEVE